jgi:hypothetical protein
MSTSSQSLTSNVSLPRTPFHMIEADGVRVFYREADPTNQPIFLVERPDETSQSEYT